MTGRRSFVGALAIGPVLPMYSDAFAARPWRPTWVRLRGSDSGYSIAVNDVEVDLAGLDAAVLSQAMASNPGQSEAEVRRKVRIYLHAEPQVSYRAVLEVLQHMRFERIGIVGEDRG